MPIDYINPSFELFPVNNNRTAWRPIGLPVILVTPQKRDANGASIPNSQVFNVQIVIENTPRTALVAGHDHVGLRYPDAELYAKYLSSLELAECFIDLNSVEITRDGEPVTIEQAINGDKIQYTTSSGVISEVEYIVGADYYDLSSILIENETLPSGNYNLLYQAEYYERVASKDETPEFLCINPNQVGLALLRFPIQHPGIILQEFVKLTPPPYLTNSYKSQDTTIGLYRPFTDALQDIHDEQGLLERVNWVFDAPPQIVPYLSSLLGWDLPYFPKSLDNMRRAVLRRTVEFQNLKGSKRALTEVFRLFGFEILITSLWWSSDGKRLIRPGEKLPDPYTNQQIEIAQNDQVDLCLNDISLGSQLVYEIPLLFRPQIIDGLDEFQSSQDGGPVTIDAYVVKNGSQAHNTLSQLAQLISESPDTFGLDADISEDQSGFYNAQAIHQALEGQDIVSYSQILVTGSLGQASDDVQVGVLPPLIRSGVRLNRETNVLNITLNGYYDTRDDYKLYLFATYKRVDIIVPSMLNYMQSNKFDVQIITRVDQEYADPVTLEFAIEFLYRLKAFHSLLNSIKTRIELNETYEVTDLCVGGIYAQRYDTDIGRLQVPPAIIPNLPASLDDCSKLDPVSLGYKPQDLLLRKRKLDNLQEEYAAWLGLKDRTSSDSSQSRIAAPVGSSSDCKYNWLGQDKVNTPQQQASAYEYGPSPNANSSSGLNKLSPIVDVVSGQFDPVGPVTSGSNANYGPFKKEYTDYRESFCEINSGSDYCYKGRVEDQVLHQTAIVAVERYRSVACNLSMGSGVYYAYPTLAKVAVAGTSSPANKSKTSKTVFTGGSTSYNFEQFSNSSLKPYLKAPYNQPSSIADSSWLSRLYRSYDTPEGQTIHYSNRPGDFADQRQYLAIQRPSLDVIKTAMHLPGCQFPAMNALLSDYTNSSIKARPWDPQFSTICGPLDRCGRKLPSYLNYTMSIGSDGNEYLQFDDVDYNIEGNGLTPDITSLGDHEIITGHEFQDSDVIHSIYSNNANSNPAVEFTQLCDYDTSILDGTTTTEDPLFSSHASCNTGGYKDFADGYKCLYGYVNYSGQDAGDYGEALEGLGLLFDATSVSQQILFRLSSGIYTGEPAYRLDCGCNVVSCGETESNSTTICSSAQYLDHDGNWDWDSDHLQLLPTLSLNNSLDIVTLQCNGYVTNMLETL